jgi:outer membrane protein OmpA-like peptidoglycan-associated protein
MHSAPCGSRHERGGGRRAVAARIALAGLLSLAPAACDRGLEIVEPPPPAAVEIGVDSPLARLCNLERSAVFFRVDSTRLLPAARERLQKIAACATRGPARDRGLQLVGRSSPFGSEAQNRRLGRARAETVAAYLDELGVDRARLQIVSLGEKGATENSYYWQLEERVSIKLRGP